MRYTFGDTTTADERLRKIADFFNPLASAFISEHIQTAINSALDLGCGPGYTTDMLAKTTKAGTVTGIDISDNFLESAGNRFQNYHFVKYDIRNMPLPVKADIIYFRFLLSHLENIRQLVEGWMSALTRGGYLIIDELEDIYTDSEVFKTYLSVNDGLIKSQGANLYIGKQLDQELNGLNIFQNVSALIPVNDHLAASWFFPNTISVWEKEEWVRNNLNQSDRKKISDELLKISENPSEKSSITWRMRKIILQA